MFNFFQDFLFELSSIISVSNDLRNTVRTIKDFGSVSSAKQIILLVNLRIKVKYF